MTANILITAGGGKLPQNPSETGKPHTDDGAIDGRLGNSEANLTEAQIFLILHGNRPPAFLKEMCVTWRQLQRRGLGGDVTLTPLGVAVRKYLRETRP